MPRPQINLATIIMIITTIKQLIEQANNEMQAIACYIIEELEQEDLDRTMQQQFFLCLSTYLFEVPSFYDAMPFLIIGTLTTRTRTGPSDGEHTFSNYHYWEITHPHLTDNDNARTSYRALYRMSKKTFEYLVNSLIEHPVFQFTAANALPAYIQISCAIWRLANTHIGYRTQHMSWGVSHGSYMNFKRRFVEAVVGVFGPLINWPSTDLNTGSSFLDMTNRDQKSYLSQLGLFTGRTWL